MASRKTFFIEGKQIQGPITSQQFKALAKQGRILPDTKFCFEQDGRPTQKWRLARDIPGLFSEESRISPANSVRSEADPSSSPPTNRAQQQHERRLKKKRAKQKIWIATGAGFAIIVVIVGLAVVSDDADDSRVAKKIRSSDSRDTSYSSSSDPVTGKFKRLVDNVRKNSRTSIKWIKKGTYTGGPNVGKDYWIRGQRNFGLPKYDIQKTNSVVAPYSGVITVSVTTLVYIDLNREPQTYNGETLYPSQFLSEEGALTAIKTRIDDERIWKEEYEWRDGAWHKTSRGLACVWPFDSKVRVRKKSPWHETEIKN